jgi:hypothetical protein
MIRLATINSVLRRFGFVLVVILEDGADGGRAYTAFRIDRATRWPFVT